MSVLVFFMLMFEAAPPAQTVDGLVYVATYVDIQISSIDQGVALIKQYRDATRTERGGSGVRLIQEIARPNRFVIIEIWKDQSSFEAHERAQHTFRFRGGITAIHNSPFDQRVHHGFAIDPRQSTGEPDVISVVTH